MRSDAGTKGELSHCPSGEVIKAFTKWQYKKKQSPLDKERFPRQA